jgi:hypothetical protein
MNILNTVEREAFNSPPVFVASMTLSLSSKVSIASTDGLLGLALIACKPELFPSGLTTSRSSSLPAKPFGTDAATRLKRATPEQHNLGSLRRSYSKHHQHLGHKAPPGR